LRHGRGIRLKVEGGNPKTSAIIQTRAETGEKRGAGGGHGT